MKLVIGNKNYSSWSLRPWLLLTHFHLPFEEVQESLLQHQLKQRLGKYSPSARVPVLIDKDLTVWDSLAICEYVSEKYLDGRAWPARQEARVNARSIVSEMHAGFASLRNEIPMNCRAKRKVDLSAGALADIQRVDDIWSRCTQSNHSAGPWLFGEFSIADCFYAPVVLRFETYGIGLSEHARNYSNQFLAHDGLKQWTSSALKETEIVPEDEAGV